MSDPSSTLSAEEALEAEIMAFLTSDEDYDPLGGINIKSQEEILDQLLPIKGTKKTFLKNDLVWRVRIWKQPTFTKKESRAARNEDMKKKPEEFYANKEWLEAGIYIVKQARGSGKNKTKAVLRSVYDGTKYYPNRKTDLFDEYVPRGELFPFVSDARHVLAMFDTIKGSFHRYELVDTYASYLKNLERQVNVILQYSRLKLKLPQIVPLDFLQLDDWKREEYLAQYDPEVRERLDRLRRIPVKKVEVEEESAASPPDEVPVQVPSKDRKRVMESDSEEEEESLFEKKRKISVSVDDDDDDDTLKKIAPERVLKFLSTKSLSKRLLNIMRGQFHHGWDRHSRATNGEHLTSCQHAFYTATGMVVDDKGFTDKAVKRLEAFYDEHREELVVQGPGEGKIKPKSEDFRYKYVTRCLLPEAVIYFIQSREVGKSRRQMPYPAAEERMRIGEWVPKKKEQEQRKED